AISVPASQGGRWSGPVGEPRKIPGRGSRIAVYLRHEEEVAALGERLLEEAGADQIAGAAGADRAEDEAPALRERFVGGDHLHAAVGDRAADLLRVDVDHVGDVDPGAQQVARPVAADGAGAPDRHGALAQGMAAEEVELRRVELLLAVHRVGPGQAAAAVAPGEQRARQLLEFR